MSDNRSTANRPTSADVYRDICPVCNTVHAPPMCPSKSQFRETDSLSISSEVTVSVDSDRDWIVIRDTDTNGPSFLDTDDARALRDWLNKVLP